MSTAAARILNPLLQLLDERDVDRAPVLAAAGLPPDAPVGGQARIEDAALAAACVAANAAADDEALCLTAGFCSTPAHLGVLGHVLLNCATVGDAWTQLQRYWKLVHDQALLHIDPGPQLTTLSLRRDPAVDPEHARPLIEYLRALLLRLSGSLTGGEQRGGHYLRGIDCRHQAPSDLTHYRQRFGQATLQFAQPRNAVHVDSALMAHPVPTADAQLHAVMTQQADRQLALQRPGADLIARVEQQIRRALPGQTPALGDVAQACAMSRASLQRKLAAADTSYQALVERVRHALADQWLADSTMSIGEVAFSLGYGDTAAFHHAYKRWTGLTPSQARA